MPLPKHPSLFLYGSREARRILQPQEFQGFISITHLRTLPLISAMLHVQWYPSLAHELTDKLDTTFGFLLNHITSHAHTAGEFDEEKAIAEIYQQVSKALCMEKGEMEGMIWASVTVSNIYQLLRMCEIVLTEERETQGLLPLSEETHPLLKSMQSLKMTGISPQTCPQTVSLALPLFGDIAQRMADNDDLCRFVPDFVDSMIASLASDHATSEEMMDERLMEGVIQTMSFLLLASHTFNQLVDGSECMRVGK